MDLKSKKNIISSLPLKNICDKIIKKELGRIGTKVECMSSDALALGKGIVKGKTYTIVNFDKEGPRLNCGYWAWWSGSTSFRKVF